MLENEEKGEKKKKTCNMSYEMLTHPLPRDFFISASTHGILMIIAVPLIFQGDTGIQRAKMIVKPLN